MNETRKSIKSKMLKYLFDIYIRHNEKHLDPKGWCEEYLKNNGYARSKKYYTKAFVVVEIRTNEKGELNEIVFTHDIDSNPNQYVIKSNFCTGIMISCSYFERI